MIKKIVPLKLKKGDKIAIISPADSIRSCSSIKDLSQIRIESEYGVHIQYGKNCFDFDTNEYTSVQKRVADIHDAFSNHDINAIITSTGGYNSNDLLPLIDWDLVKNNPKIFMGSSDITVILNAIYAKTGIVTYYGPNYYRFAMKYGLEYSLDYLFKALFSKKPYFVKQSKQWSNDKWYIDQENRVYVNSDGFVTNVEEDFITEGTIVGGNLCSLNLLQGTDYMPSLENSVLFIEDDDMAGNNTEHEFIRNLRSLAQTVSIDSIRGIVIGRFSPSCCVNSRELLTYLKSDNMFRSIPVIAELDFGHCEPSITFPIGGNAKIKQCGKKISIQING